MKLLIENNDVDTIIEDDKNLEERLNTYVDMNDEVCKNVRNELYNMIQSKIHDNLAVVLSSSVDGYNSEWCDDDNNSYEEEVVTEKTEALIDALMNVLFKLREKQVTENFEETEEEKAEDESLSESVSKDVQEVADPVMADAMRDHEETEKIKEKAAEITKDGKPKITINESFDPFDALNKLEENIKRGK